MKSRKSDVPAVTTDKNQLRYYETAEKSVLTNICSLFFSLYQSILMSLLSRMA